MLLAFQVFTAAYMTVVEATPTLIGLHQGLPVLDGTVIAHGHAGPAAALAALTSAHR
jgi:hypothetical protein